MIILLLIFREDSFDNFCITITQKKKTLYDNWSFCFLRKQLSLYLHINRFVKLNYQEIN